MDWVIDHMQVWVLIAVAIVAILQKMKGLRAGNASAPPVVEDPEQAERTRRIQEEIRRRILERRGQLPGAPAMPGPEEEPAPETTPFPAAPPMIEEVRPVVVPPPPVASENEQREWQRQQALQEQMRALESAALPAAPAAPATSPAVVPAPGDSALRLAELRRPSGLRRAVILREVLGPPVGLR